MVWLVPNLSACRGSPTRVQYHPHHLILHLVQLPYISIASTGNVTCPTGREALQLWMCWELDWLVAKVM